MRTIHIFGTGIRWSQPQRGNIPEIVSRPRITSIRDFAPVVFGHGGNGHFCVLACYIDDSADAKQQIVFNLSGLIADTLDWFEVERKWMQRLERDGLDYFRTVDCLNLTGEFRKLVDRHGLGTARTMSESIMADLKAILKNSPVQIFSVAVVMDDYRIVSGEPQGARVLLHDPYYYAHEELIYRVAKTVGQSANPERVAFVFDEHKKAAGLESRWSEYKELHPRAAECMGSLSAWDDKYFQPLQAADLISHTSRKAFERRTANPSAELAEMEQWREKIVWWSYQDADYLRAIVSDSIRRAKGEDLPEQW